MQSVPCASRFGSLLSPRPVSVDPDGHSLTHITPSLAVPIFSPVGPAQNFLPLAEAEIPVFFHAPIRTHCFLETWLPARQLSAAFPRAPTPRSLCPWQLWAESRVLSSYRQLPDSAFWGMFILSPQRDGKAFECTVVCVCVSHKTARSGLTHRRPQHSQRVE